MPFKTIVSTETQTDCFVGQPIRNYQKMLGLCGSIGFEVYRRVTIGNQTWMAEKTPIKMEVCWENHRTKW